MYLPPRRAMCLTAPAGTCASTVPGFASPAKAPTPQQLLLHSRRKSSQLHAISSWFHLLLWLCLQVGRHSRTEWTWAWIFPFSSVEPRKRGPFTARRESHYETLRLSPN